LKKIGSKILANIFEKCWSSSENVEQVITGGP
jgi:hypothetical protein